MNSINDLVEGATKYHLAVENRDLELLKTASKKDLEILDRDGESVFHYAAVNDDLEICKLLLKLNPSLKEIKCIEGKTALDWAKEYYNEYNSHLDIITYLI